MGSSQLGQAPRTHRRRLARIACPSKPSIATRKPSQQRQTAACSIQSRHGACCPSGSSTRGGTRETPILVLQHYYAVACLSSGTDPLPFLALVLSHPTFPERRRILFLMRRRCTSTSISLAGLYLYGVDRVGWMPGSTAKKHLDVSDTKPRQKRRHDKLFFPSPASSSFPLLHQPWYRCPCRFGCTVTHTRPAGDRHRQSPVTGMHAGGILALRLVFGRRFALRQTSFCTCKAPLG